MNAADEIFGAVKVSGWYLSFLVQKSIVFERGVVPIPALFDEGREKRRNEWWKRQFWWVDWRRWQRGRFFCV